MIKKNHVLISILASLFVVDVSFADNDWGLIVHDHYDCENDHMAIETHRGWLLAEAYPPYSPLREGAYILGDLTGYGFRDVLVFSSKDDDSPREARIYIDNYWMSDDNAEVYCFAGEDL